MIHGISSHLFVNHRLTTVWLERIWEAGVPLVEIFCARQNFDYRNSSQVEDLGYFFRDSELKVNSIHAPMYNDDCWGRTGPSAVVNISDTEKVRRITGVDEIKRALDVVEYIPFRYMIQHVGVAGDEYDPRKIDATFDSLDELNVFARHRGVEILLENIQNSLASAERLLLLLTQTHLENNFCFDVGHANMHPNGIKTEFELMKDRIRSTHIHDNDGESDSHLFPFSSPGGNINWKETMELLRSRPDQYPLMLELREVEAMEHPIQEAKACLERLENS